MAKITTNLKELRNADVAYISLVDRAATRIPFRILKREDKESSMSINLSGLGKAVMSAKKAEPKPSVSAVVVLDNPDAAYMEGVTNALKEQGFSVDRATKNDDGSITYAQDNTPIEDTQLVKVSDQLLVAMKGFDVYSESLRENCDFNEFVAASGFFTGLSTAFDGLYATIGASLHSADDQTDVATSVSDALGKFSSYVTSLVAGLPATAFKADQSLQLLARKSSEEKNTDLKDLPTDAPKGITQNDWDEMGEDDKLAWIKDSTNQSPQGGTLKEDAMTNATKTDNNTILALAEFLKKAPSGSDGTAWAAMSDVDKLAWYTSSYNAANASGAQVGNDIPGGAVPAAKSEAEAAAETAVAAAVATETAAAEARIAKTESDIASLAGAMGKLAESVNTMVAKMDAQSTNFATQIEAIAQKSDVTLSKVAGVVIAPASAGDTPAGRVQSIAKSDSTDPRSGSFDTAFIRKAERNRR
jgi:hypothetical protein